MLQLSLNASGGLALFLLAMMMMTEGLKVYAGGALKHMLGNWTSTPRRGVLSGILVTGVVQSSSAVTVATIGFVNAGVLSLRQALGVIFGTNVGTTMTAWLVSLIGFGFKIDNFALPILSVGVALHLFAPGKRYQGLGQALAGFGLFFLGLSILAEAFGGLAESYGSALPAAAQSSRLAFLGIGFVATLLTQSSSAAIAIILSAATGGMVGIDAAAAAVIGANIGTTSTAALAVIRATPNAKRLALGHILFNLITGVVALLLLPLMLWFIAWLNGWIGAGSQPAVLLALFHTVFNLLGVAIMLPLANPMAAVLERMFRNAEEDIGRPQHLDSTLASTPEFALPAVRQELLRLRSLVNATVATAISDTATTAGTLESRAAALRNLGEAIAGFVSHLRTGVMPLDIEQDLARALRIARYLDESARLAPRAHALHQLARLRPGEASQAPLQQVLALASACVVLAERDEDTPGSDREREAAFERFQAAYEAAKTAVLGAVVNARFAVEQADALLDNLSATRRLVEQLVKADRLLRSPEKAGMIEQENGPHSDAPQAD